MAGEDALLFEANRKRREKSDSWPAFPATRNAILKYIVENQVQNVVFLTGDIHCSNIARIEFSGTPEAKKLAVHDITSSALYWPFPFADGDPNAYVHDSTVQGQIDRFPLQGTGVEANYRAWGFTQEDNFCRVEIDKAKGTLRVRVFDRQGALVQVTNDRGKLVKENLLPLAAWD